MQTNNRALEEESFVNSNKIIGFLKKNQKRRFYRPNKKHSYKHRK